MKGPLLFIAVDPGAKGAIASFVIPTIGDAPFWAVERLSETPQDRFSQFEGYGERANALNTPRIAILEDVGGFTGVPQPGSRMFNFGRNFGQLEGCLVSLGYQIKRVRPQKWQAALSLKSRKGESKPEHKRRMRAKALDLWPQLKPTLDTCDALLLLYYHVHHGEK